MSAFPNSPRLLKGAIVGNDPLNPLASVVVFQYNPDTMTRRLEPRVVSAEGDRGEAFRLTGLEIKYAKDVFKDGIDYSVTTITRDSLLSTEAPRALGNTIHLRSDWGHFKSDTLELTQKGMEMLIHEMGHVWQYQNGGPAYIPESLWAQFKAAVRGKSRNAAYDWRAVHAAKVHWEQWNPEQQTEAIEDYNKSLRKSKDGTATSAELAELSALVPYMRHVWRRQWAPHFTPPKLEGPT